MFRVGMYRSAGWCFSCGRQTVMVKPRVNHLLHLALSVVTLGLWLIVWAALGFRNSERPPVLRELWHGGRQRAYARRVRAADALTLSASQPLVLGLSTRSSVRRSRPLPQATTASAAAG